LLAGLPAERARLVRTLNDRVLVVHPVSPEVAEGLGPVADQVIRSVEEAFTQGRCLRFEYQDGRGRRTARLVEPHGLLIRTPAWYLLSRDVHKDAARMFRMDRISAPQVEAARSFLPDIDALYALWHAQEAERATPTAPDRSRDR
jgi:predicted DNA-binding transcriptional regulator YafY